MATVFATGALLASVPFSALTPVSSVWKDLIRSLEFISWLAKALLGTLASTDWLGFCPKLSKKLSAAPFHY
jgi:hypothetical protein